MDERLLEYFERELAYLREQGKEFAGHYPQIANSLGDGGTEIDDPYVERLLEGFGFLTARVRLKMDAQFPQFAQRLLDIIYPNYLAPTPSMAIVQFQPSGEAGAAQGVTVPRGSPLMGGIAKGEATACEFRTTHNVTIWPVGISDAKCAAVPPAFAGAGRVLGKTVKGTIRIRLSSTDGTPLARLGLERLDVFLAGTYDMASHLYEMLFSHVIGVATQSPGKHADVRILPFEEAIKAEGFDAEQSIMPYHGRAFEGHRLLHEYFAFPDRFLFFSLTGLDKLVAEGNGNTVELIILFDRPTDDLEDVIDQKQFALFCTPAVNLFPKRCDRIAISPHRAEYHVVADRRAPRDFEIHSVIDSSAHASGGKSTAFRPLYDSMEHDRHAYGAYFALRREPRVVSETAARNGTRTSYIGSEAFLSLSQQGHTPFDESLTSLSVTALCTNRDLALLLPVGGKSDFTFETALPIGEVKILRGPTEPLSALDLDAGNASLIGLLNQNFFTLTELDRATGAQVLRALLSLYCRITRQTLKKQVEAIQSFQATQTIRRLPRKGPLMRGKGVALDLVLDETLFAGASAFLFGAVLANYFRHHVAVNTLCETTLHSLQRGEIGRWPPRLSAM